MLLRTLGELSLDGHDFREQKPLLLLAYLSWTGRSVRNEVAERFWGASGSLPLAQKSLQEALRKLRRLGDGVVLAPSDREVATAIATDVALLEEALAVDDRERILALYRNPLLMGVERSSRLNLGEELREWIVEKREELHGRVQGALLRAAEGLARGERFEEAADLALATLRLGPLATYPTPDEYLRIHALLLAGGRPEEAEGVAAEAVDLYGDLAFAESPFAARARLTLRATLPALSELFVGRGEELTLLLTLLQGSAPRIVTLLGPPGVGKTELATAVAHEVRERQMVPRGLAFVACEELAPDSGVGELLDRIASALHLGPLGAPEPAELAARIGERRTLVVLDTMEHLVHHAGALAELVRAGRAVTLLVTSRRVLDLERERVVALDGLEYEVRGADGSGGPAVRLFVDAYRRRAGPDAHVDLEVAREIARLTGGLPLALLLAAGWGRSATPEQIAERLARSLDLLSVASVDIAERQRSLAAALEATLDLLTPKQRGVLRRLAVFRGGYDLEAVERVLGVGLFALRPLIDHALLMRDAESGRYRQHPLVRRFVRELEGAAELPEALVDAHARHYLERLRETTSEDSELRNRAPRRLQPDTINIAAAWRTAIVRRWEGELDASAEALMLFADTSARFRWGLELLAESERSIGGRVGAHLLAHTAWFHLRLGDPDRGLTTAREALDRLEGDVRPARRAALNALGACHGTRGEYEAAASCFEQLLELEEAGSGYEATAQTNLGLTLANIGDFDRAEELLRRAIATYRRLGRLAGQIQATHILAGTLLDRGDASDAIGPLREALAQTEGSGHHQRRMNLLINLASALFQLRGDHEVEPVAREAIDLATYGDDAVGLIRAEGLLAASSVLRGELDRAHEALVRSLEAAREGRLEGVLVPAFATAAEALLRLGEGVRATLLLRVAQRLADAYSVGGRDRRLLTRLEREWLPEAPDEERQPERWAAAGGDDAVAAALREVFG